MKIKIYKIIIIFYMIIFSTLYGKSKSNMFNLEYKYLSNKNMFVLHKKNYYSNEQYKTPSKALLYSALIPGMGQIYAQEWIRGLMFLALDGLAMYTWKINNDLSVNKKDEYSDYAYNHWSFGRWIEDYYKWYEFKDDESWDSIRDVFTNHSDSTSGCAQNPANGDCYIDIWDHAHSVEFLYNGSIVSSSSNEFVDIFQYLCNNPNDDYNGCFAEEVNLNDNNGDSILVIRDHHFYEGIQKYDMFFAGWDDNSSVILVTKEHGDKNATSPNQIAYRKLWNDYNKLKTLAVNGGKFMLLNRFVSMIDAFLLIKKQNNKLNMSFNLYPDLRNKFGVGGINLRLYYR